MLLGRPGVRRLDRPLGLPELVAARTWSASLRRFLELPDELPVLPGPRRHHHGGARARDEPVPAGPRLMELAPPRGTPDLLPTGPTRCSACTRRRIAPPGCSGSATSRRPTFEHTELFARTAGDDLRRRDEGDVHVRGQGRALADAPPGADGAAWCAPTSTHAHDLPLPFKGVLRRLAVPARPPAGGPAARVPAVGRRGDRRRPGPAADVEVIALGERYLRERGLAPYVAPPELDRRRGTAAPPTASCSSPTSSRTATELDEDCRTRLSHEPAADPRLQGRRRTSRSCWTRRRSPTTCASACAAHFAAVRAGLDEAGVALPARPAAGARPRLLHAHGVRVRLGGALVGRRHRPCARAGATTGWPRRSAAPPTPGVGFAMGLDRVLLAMEAEGAPLPPHAGPRCFVVAIGEAAAEPAARAGRGAPGRRRRGRGQPTRSVR